MEVQRRVWGRGEKNAESERGRRQRVMGVRGRGGVWQGDGRGGSEKNGTRRGGEWYEEKRERESRVGRERLTKVMLAVSLTSCSSVGVRS